MMVHRSSSDTVRDTGILASALIRISFCSARESLLFNMASAMRFPVFTTVSTLVRSWSSMSRYLSISAYSPFAAWTFMAWI